MELIHFHKYQATGNDFIMIDDRKRAFDRIGNIPELCDRRFGIGSDGLILIREHPEADFEMVYFNPDGSQSLCGNGSRCAVKFAEKLGLVHDKCSFMAFDGLHEASLLEDERVRLGMSNVQNVMLMEDGMFVDTGSPHLIRFVSDVDSVDVTGQGKEIRYNHIFRENGVNVNFVEIGKDNRIHVRTYERGVENETFSCGTGVTAAALAANGRGLGSPVGVTTRGGELTVEFRPEGKRYKDIWLTGPAREVFEGKMRLNK